MYADENVIKIKHEVLYEVAKHEHTWWKDLGIIRK